MRIFFASGQAYVAHSRVRTLNDLVSWCDNVDIIHPTPPTGIFEHPDRTHDFLSNAPIPDLSTKDDKFKTGSIQYLILILPMLINKVPQQKGEGASLRKKQSTRPIQPDTA